MNKEQKALYDTWSKRDIYEAYLVADNEANQAQHRYNQEVRAHKETKGKLMEATSKKICEVKETTVKEIFKYKELFEQYANESKCDLVPKVNASKALYQEIEDNGGLYVTACYDEDKMVGFLVMINHIMPHYSKQASTVESIFVLREYRKSGAGIALLNNAMDKAKELGSSNFFLSAPMGSTLIKATKGFGLTKTHEIFTKAL